MISRRNIRVKVMQTLYTIDTLEQEVKPGEPVKLLQKHFDESRSLLIYMIEFLNQVLSYAETDAHHRASKHLPTAQDLNVNTKIAGNELLWRIKEDTSFTTARDTEKLVHRIDKDLVRRIYVQLTESAEYKAYIASPERKKDEERTIVHFVWEQLILPNEAFLSHIEELYMNWDDDGEMAIQLFLMYLAKPGTFDFRTLISADKWSFAKGLLQAVLEKAEHLETFIHPRLQNWDAERIAVLDMILMKMGVAEFLYFDTIPPKVTINEYIDLAKEYSTAQSGQFVNGILDNIHKELVQTGKLQKTDFRKA
ncbi:transcription antitermination factor NusB [Pseudocnuella soli]|uniref:transcription antitermination factor NusB n=1 Tax=Pseudocnuella soli TaxID=2502779 RepID=UPI00104FC24B|nr:transcription antitermination factor NusB [Pseudocnuella soli]